MMLGISMELNLFVLLVLEQNLVEIFTILIEILISFRIETVDEKSCNDSTNDSDAH